MPNKSKQEYNAYMKDYMLVRYHKRRTLAIAFLGGECEDCGSEENLEFDHVDPETKSFTIGKMWSVNEAAFWDEVEKCQLLCHDCHIIKSIDDAGLQNGREVHGTLASYRYCKCDECKAAKSAYGKSYRLGSLA